MGYKNDSTTGDPQGGAYIHQILTEPLHIQVNSNIDAMVLYADGSTYIPNRLTVPTLLNDNGGAFTTQGTTLCQAPESGQLTSPSGVCMQYTPSIGFAGGAGAIFGIKGATSDYTSPSLTVSALASSGSSSIKVNYDPSVGNAAFNPPAGGTASGITSSVSGAIPSGTKITGVFQGNPTTFTISSPLATNIPAGATVTFTTPTGDQQMTALVGTADLTAHRSSVGQAWAGNFISQAEAGSSGAVHGIEIDASDFSSNVGGFGVWLGNNGTQNMNTGFLVGAGTNHKGWLYGLQSISAVNSDVLSTSSAGAFSDDHGTHTLGSNYQGSYTTAIIQAINPNGLTDSAKYLYTVTPKGGVIDGSPTPVAVSSGFSQTATNGTTGLILVCSGTLPSGTVAMPTSPLPKQIYHIASECSVTSISFSLLTATTIVGAASGITPSTPEAFVYDNDRLTWVRWQ